MTPATITAGLLALATGIGWARLLWWQLAARRTGAGAPWWRLALLLASQPVVAGALYLTLFAPQPRVGSDRLVVATAGAPRIVATGPGEQLVTLPEATPRPAGAEPMPDLGTALRRHPGAGAIRVVGSGLVARDREAAARVGVAFSPPAEPHGLLALVPPQPVAPGGVFTVAGRVNGGGALALLDPAGRVVDSTRAAADGGFVLTGTARMPGEALFALRLADGSLTPLPLVTRAAVRARLLIIAGAPGPEVKFLRRWAADGGLDAAARLPVGGGVSLGGADAIPSPATLARADVAIIDDRSWTAMAAGQRAAVAQAVRGGLGLVVRATGPLPRGWQVLGLVATGEALVPLRLPRAAPDAAALAARRGPGTQDVPARAAAGLGEVPDLTRVAAKLGGVPLLRDAAGVPYAAWRSVGRGRVAIVTLTDSFALATSGNGDAYAAIWSALASAVGRGTPTPALTVTPLPRAGERMALCGARAVAAPDGSVIPLVPDPHAQGCAALWPQTAGWYRTGGDAFYVYSADALLALRVAERRDATLTLVGERVAPVTPLAADRAPSWRWFCVFLAAAGALWWLERRRGRA